MPEGIRGAVHESAEPARTEPAEPPSIPPVRGKEEPPSIPPDRGKEDPPSIPPDRGEEDPPSIPPVRGEEEPPSIPPVRGEEKGGGRPRRKKRIRPAREKRHLLARIEYILFLALFAFFRALPFRLAFRIGEGIGALLYWLDRPHRRVGLTNLALAFPAKDKAERHRILRESFRNLGRLLAEFCHLRSLTPENIHERVQFENEAEWRQLVDNLRATGALILTGHFGNWELFAHAAACYGLPIHIIHRRLRNVFIEKVLTTERERGGTTVIKKTTAGIEVFRAIKKKSAVVAAVDQNASGRMGVFVPFFSRLASTSAGLAGLALTTGVPVVPAFLIRENGSSRHKIVILPLIEPVRTGNQEEDIRATTAKFTAIFQDMVERYPDHWLWIHKRWKRRPAGDTPVYRSTRAWRKK